MITPYQYQTEAVDATIEYFKQGHNNPIIVAPTGAGKSIIIALLIGEIIKIKPDARILVLAHRKELLSQNSEELHMLSENNIDYGIASASLNKKQYNKKVVFGQIQTVAKKSAQLGYIDVCIIDECQFVNYDEKSMYRRLLSDLEFNCQHFQCIGLTATPFRAKGSKTVNLHEGDFSLFKGISYEVTFKQVAEEGRICDLVCPTPKEKFDLSKLTMSGNDFNLTKMQGIFDIPDKVKAMCYEIYKEALFRKGVIIFASGKEHAEHIKECLISYHSSDPRIELVFGDTPQAERDKIVEEYKQKKFKFLINYGCFTEGFNAKHVDLVVLARATKSVALYMQMVGRGLRVTEGKENCMIMDFGGNIKRHGCVDLISYKMFSPYYPSVSGEAPIRECPKCYHLMHPTAKECEECGYEFPFEEHKEITKNAEKRAIMSENCYEWFDVDSVEVFRNNGKLGKKDTLRIEYHCGINTYKEWICIEHDGYARNMAIMKLRMLKYPDNVLTIDELLRFIPSVNKIRVSLSEKFPKVVQYDGIDPPIKKQQEIIIEEEDAFL